MNHLKNYNNDNTSQDSIDNTYAFTTSFAQQRLCFLDRLLGASSLYNIPRAIQLNGKLDVSALQQSFTAMIERHEVFRTAFAEQDGDSLQLISASIPFQCRQVDLSALPQDTRESASTRILDIEANKPFDLKQAPLIRALLVKLSTQEYILLVTLHHIISDGWSMGIFQQELTHCYNAFSKGQSSTLPELPIQYADYSVWQREWLQGEVLEKQLSYWKNQLADSPILDLPSDYSRPQQLSYQGARESIQLSTELTQSLKTLSQDNGVTLFMTLLAAFQVLLHRYSGQDDIVVGSPIAGRNKQEIEGLIGFFINTLVLRSDLSGAPDFSELLQRIRNTCIDAYTHQDIPFEKLVAELNPQRDLSRNPFFDILVNQLDIVTGSVNLKGLKTQSLELSNIIAKFPITLYINANEENIRLTIDYQVELFSAVRISTILEQYQYLLVQIITAPTASIANYSLVTAKLTQLLPDPGKTLQDIPQPLVQDSFLKWASCAPDNIAISLHNQQWTYHELADASVKLAFQLLNIGLKKGQVVAITGESGFGLIANIIAVFLSGGVILTIDKQLPIKRKRFMLSSAATKILCIIRVVLLKNKN